MTIELNHTIVNVRDKRKSADFFCEVFGLPPAVPFGPFLGVKVANGVTLDFVSEGTNQPPRRRPRRLLRGSGQALPRDHHPALRRRVIEHGRR